MRCRYDWMLRYCMSCMLWCWVIRASTLMLLCASTLLAAAASGASKVIIISLDGATPAHGAERTQVVPLLNTVKVHTDKRGRPRKRLQVFATDKGYDAKALRQQLQQRGSWAQLPERGWKSRKNQSRLVKQVVHGAKPSAPLPGSRRYSAAW